MLGSAGWIGLEPAVFTRSEAASGRPAGGRRVLQRDGALGTCAESARARTGYPQPKTRSQRFPGPESKISDERETPDSTCTQQTLRTPAKLFTSSAAELLSLPPPFPFCVYPWVSASPATAQWKGRSPHQWEHLLDGAQKPSLGPLPPFLSHTYRCSSQFLY